MSTVVASFSIDSQSIDLVSTGQNVNNFNFTLNNTINLETIISEIYLYYVEFSLSSVSICQCPVASRIWNSLGVKYKPR